MKAYKIRYPWSVLRRGQGFFVPCVDTDATREEGLKQALSLRLLDARAIPGVHAGFMGVWFYRLPLEG